jgi:HD-like signal output (HDOD) protein
MIQVDDKILSDIGRGFSVPAQPALLLKIQSLMTDDDPDINDIADAISQDVAVSATILKTINSPIYGLARSISDIKKSVRYIGIQGIVTLVTSSLLKKSFGQNSCSIELDDFWSNATNIANTAVYIGKNIKRKVSSEKLFTIGLFHDCGIPVMATKFADYADTLKFSGDTPSKTLPDFEESVYQVNHATIGYYVASSWRLPKDICQLILQHHERDYLRKLDNSEGQLNYAILKLAENIVHQQKHLTPSADWPFLQDSILTVLDIDEEDVKDIMEDINEQAELG